MTIVNSLGIKLICAKGYISRPQIEPVSQFCRFRHQDAERFS